MAYPQIRVEAAFTVGTSKAFVLNDAVKGVLDTSTLSEEVWEDITAYADEFSTRRGANRAEGPIVRFEAGSMTVRLDNSDRRFDPTNLEGPYVAAGVSQVTPMRKVRVGAVYLGTYYPIFAGYADSWDISYDGPSMSTCVLSATDATKVLADFDRVALGTAVGAGELSGARVNRVLDSISWPAEQRDIDAGNTALQATTMDRSAWEEVKKVADSEIGYAFVDARGYVCFRSRHSNMKDPRSTQVQAAFGDGVGELPFEDHTIEYDEDGLLNVIRIARTGGVQQVAQDAASQSQYLSHSYERTDLLLQTDAESADYASFVLYQSKDPELRFNDLSVLGHDDEDGLFPKILGLEFGDLVTLTRRPPGGGAVTTRRCFIIGVSHSVPGPNQWKTTWGLQSATKWSFLTLDHTESGKMDSNALAY